MFLKGAALLLMKITVVVYNSEAVPGRELDRAEAVAGRILRQAGIEVQWRQATSADLRPRPSEIPLHLLGVHPPNLAPNTGGFAVLMPDGSYTGISWPGVQHMASALELDAATFLGAVISHELGHVLLGSSTHSASGVMVARFGIREIDAAARGELQFLRSEARQIRAEAARRATIPR